MSKKRIKKECRQKGITKASEYAYPPITVYLDNDNHINSDKCKSMQKLSSIGCKNMDLIWWNNSSIYILEIWSKGKTMEQYINSTYDKIIDTLVYIYGIYIKSFVYKNNNQNEYITNNNEAIKNVMALVLFNFNPDMPFVLQIKDKIFSKIRCELNSLHASIKIKDVYVYNKENVNKHIFDGIYID